MENEKKTGEALEAILTRIKKLEIHKQKSIDNGWVLDAKGTQSVIDSLKTWI